MIEPPIDIDFALQVKMPKQARIGNGIMQTGEILHWRTVNGKRVEWKEVPEMRATIAFIYSDMRLELQLTREHLEELLDNVNEALKALVPQEK